MTTLQSDVVLLNSTERTSGTVSQAVYNLTAMGGIGPGTYNFMGYQSVNHIYNVESGVNDNIYFNEGAGGFVGTLPAGNYNVTTLMAAIKAAMEVPGAGTYAVTQGADTSLMNIAVSGAVATFEFEWLTNTLLGDLANALLGFGVVDTGLSANHTGTQVPNLLLHTHILINILEDGRKDITNMAGDEFSASIPLPAFGDLINFREASSYDNFLSFGPTNITTINVHMFTENGTAIALPSDYTLLLQKIF